MDEIIRLQDVVSDLEDKILTFSKNECLCQVNKVY